MRFVAILAAMIFGATAFAQDVAPVRQPAVWAVRDADSTIYLFGTMHIGLDGDWSGPVAREALAQAGEVWTEMDISTLTDATTSGYVQAHGFDRKRRLSARLGPACWAVVRPALVAQGMTVEGAERLRPWFAFLALSGGAGGSGGKPIIDQTVSRKAEISGKTLRWFETGVDQLGVFAGLPEDLQVSLLCDGVTGGQAFGPGAGSDDGMEAAWSIGDDAFIAESFAAWAADYPAFYDALIRKRNARWTFMLAKELEGAGVDFVAVGAGHLAGPDSLQTMLAARGYTVERLTPPPR